MPNGQYPQAHLDALAQQMGFHDYATWAAYNAHQQALRGQNGLNGTGADQGQAAPQNWLQRLVTGIPGTPAYLLGKVNDRLGQVLGGGQ